MGIDESRPNGASNWTLATGTQPGERQVVSAPQGTDPQPGMFEVSR